MGEDDKRRKELVRTTPAGKPSKGSIDWMRSQGFDVRDMWPSWPISNAALHHCVEEAEAIDAMLVPYEAIKEELKAARGKLRRLKAALSSG